MVYEVRFEESGAWRGDNPALYHALDIVSKILQKVINDLRDQYAPFDYMDRLVSFRFESPQFRGEPLYTGYYNLSSERNMVDLIMAQFENLMQSYKELLLKDAGLAIVVNVCGIEHSKLVRKK